MRVLTMLNSLVRPHLRLGFDSGPHRIEIYDRPGHSLTQAQQDAARAEITALAQKVEPRGALDYGVFLDDPQIWNALVLTLVRERQTGALIGFNAMRWIPSDDDEMPILHLGLAMVDPDRQSQGVSWILYGLSVVLLFLRGGLKPLTISSVTQVPAVFGRIALAFAEVYPNAKAMHPSYSHLRRARSIMRDHRDVFGVGDDAWFEEDRFVIRNAYTGGSDAMKKSYDQAAHHRDTHFNDYCRDILDYARGDDFLQIGAMTLATAQNYLMRDVPKSSRRAVLMLALFALVQNWVAPLIGWLDTTRRWDELAPAGKKPHV